MNQDFEMRVYGLEEGMAKEDLAVKEKPQSQEQEWRRSVIGQSFKRNEDRKGTHRHSV